MGCGVIVAQGPASQLHNRVIKLMKGALARLTSLRVWAIARMAGTSPLRDVGKA